MFERRTLITVALLALSCSKPSERRFFAGAPVVLISIDTLRADHLPLYGYRAVETPAIDELGRDGVVFDQAWSHCPMTLPSHVSMLTGELPTTHGVRNNLGFRYDAAKHPSLPQRLQSAGYATGAAVSSYVLRGETGLRDAFQWYDDAVDPAPGARFREYQRSGVTTTALAEKWVDSIGSRPFFLFLHLYEPHVPYDPPEPFRSRYANAYDGEIATADAIVGEFVRHLKQRGLYDNSIIIITSDHGEGLGDHGELQHSILLYTELIRVPLIVKLPRGEQKGTRAKSPAALVDLVPTIAALTGLQAEKSDGIDLFAKPPASRSIYSETIYPYVQLGWSDLRSMIEGPYHYIESSRPELYDLGSDPRERSDVIAEHRRDAARMRTELEKFPPATAGDTAISSEDAAKLAALGYVGSARQRGDPKSLPNPRDVIGMLEDIRIAYQLASQQRYAEAEKAMNALLAKNPRLVDLRVRLAEMFLDMGRTDDAIREYKAAIGGSGVFPSEIAASLADAYVQAGRLDDAGSAAEAAMAGSPDKARRVEVRIALARKDVARAAKIADQLPETAGDLLLRAEVRHAAGGFRDALQLIDQADGHAKSAGEKGIYGLEALRADILARTDHTAEAVSAYEKEISLFPNNRLAYARLTVLYFTTGDRAAVDRTLERMVRANPSRAAYELAARTMEAVEDVSAARRWRSRAPR
ncbi:MAG TPA: sulfatase-like hydrolase/transferase [Thermoanaerobaculia bacterium]|nr:sulfatase-like hydrolase/transferase [Thermoanaerobaculia bacterium]